MKTKILASALAFLGIVAVPAAAQYSFPLSVPDGTQTVAQSIIEDGETGIVCRYIGTAGGGAIAVDAGTGDLTFTDGAVGALAASTAFECPVSAPLGGVIDVSDAACNTFGEVVDIVNASTTWRCLLGASLRSDTSVDTLVTIAATSAVAPTGLKLKIDSSVALTSTLVIAPLNWDDYDKLSPGLNSTSFTKNPWAQRQSVLTSAYALSTFGSGTSLLTVLAVDRTQAAAGSETVTTLWPSTVGGATTVAKVFGSCDTEATGCATAWGQQGLICPPGQQCMIRLTNSAAMSVNTLAINGLSMPNNGRGLIGVK